MTAPSPLRELPRITLGVLFIGLMIAASLWVLSPFLAPLLWATTVVVATWPLLIAVQSSLGGRRWLAVMVMTGAMLLLLIVPLFLTASTIVTHADDIAAWTATAVNAGVPSPPDWLERIPLIGSKLQAEWQRLQAASQEELAVQAVPFVRRGVEWVAGQAGSFGLVLLHFLLTVLITAILYATGETAALGVRRFARRLAAERGDESVVLAAQAIRAVALGVVGTALLQSAASGIGLFVAGIPYAAVLTAIIVVLSIAQLGPFLVLVPVVGWLYWSGNALGGTLMLVWTVLVGTLDNVVRPLLIRRGADLPLLLILAGVIGGLVSFGIIGLFVGPVILAVTYRLVDSWIAEGEKPLAGPADPAPVVVPYSQPGPPT